MGVNKTLRVGEILQILIDNLEWDGYGYWFKDSCVKERDSSLERTPEPTKTEMHDFLKKLQKK